MRPTAANPTWIAERSFHLETRRKHDPGKPESDGQAMSWNFHEME
jgi:hypothetical protein